jgi:hypothetical protein
VITTHDILEVRREAARQWRVYCTCGFYTIWCRSEARARAEHADHRAPPNTGYAEVSVVVDGALEATEEVTSESEVAALVEAIQREAEADGQETQVFVLWHAHPLVELAAGQENQEDTCAQYATSHQPAYHFNDPDAEPAWPVGTSLGGRSLRP